MDTTNARKRRLSKGDDPSNVKKYRHGPQSQDSLDSLVVRNASRILQTPSGLITESYQGPADSGVLEEARMVGPAEAVANQAQAVLQKYKGRDDIAVALGINVITLDEVDCIDNSRQLHRPPNAMQDEEAWAEEQARLEEEEAEEVARNWGQEPQAKQARPDDEDDLESEPSRVDHWQKPQQRGVFNKARKQPAWGGLPRQVEELETYEVEPQDQPPFKHKAAKPDAEEIERITTHGMESVTERPAPEQRCGHCFHYGHRLIDCAMPDRSGTIRGCPLCNTCEHTLDDCPRVELFNKFILFLACVARRSKLPPIRSARYNWLSLLSDFIEKKIRPPNDTKWKNWQFNKKQPLPLTVEFTRVMVKGKFLGRNGKPYRSWTWYNYQNLYHLECDPKTKDFDTVWQNFDSLMRTEPHGATKATEKETPKKAEAQNPPRTAPRNKASHDASVDALNQDLENYFQPKADATSAAEMASEVDVTKIAPPNSTATGIDPASIPLPTNNGDSDTEMDFPLENSKKFDNFYQVLADQNNAD